MRVRILWNITHLRRAVGPKAVSGESPGGLLLFWWPVTRTIVYIDGLNLYYRALKGTPHKWLDIEAMSRAALPSTWSVEHVNYYTARVSGRTTRPLPPVSMHTSGR